MVRLAPACQSGLSSLSHLSLLLSFAALVHPTYGHGHLTSPRSRNWVAWEDGVDSPAAGVRTREYCTHCLNTNTGVCGKSTLHNYDDNLDSTGQVMPWISQGYFQEEEIITVRSYLDTHHNGHMEIKACPMGSLSTQECFDTPGHELHFVEDVLFGMPKDENYPERGMYAGGQGGGIRDFEMKFKLPPGIYGDEVMLQWKYITANSCSPPGYPEYFSAHPDIPSSYWTTGLGLCTPPYPNDGTRSTTWPELFFNCAEISIAHSEPTISPKPTPAPMPTTTSAPVVSPTPAPVDPAQGCCSQNFKDCITWCGDTQASCLACSDVFWISGPQTGCSARYGDCTNNVSGCCDGLVCEELNPDYRQCLPGSGPPPPTPSPPPPTPTAPVPTVPSPTTPSEPTSSGTACCTIDFKNCSPTVEGWCSESESNCVNSCYKFWLPDGPLTGCTARYEPCNNDSECCSPGVCVMGQCELSNQPSSPTLSPISSPTGSPVIANATAQPTDAPTSKPTNPPSDPPVASTPEPTDSPTSQPTISPSNPPVVPEGCFSNNYKDCIHPDYAGAESCSKIWLPAGAQSNCIALWMDCTGQESSCCGPATCFGDSEYATCVPNSAGSPTNQPTPPCTICTDIETDWMVNNGKDCATSSLVDTKCNKAAGWISNKFCQLSCYNAGNGYDGDVCCNAASRRLRGSA